MFGLSIVSDVSIVPGASQLLEFKIVTPLKTVHRFLDSHGALKLLEDPLMLQARICPPPPGQIAPSGKTPDSSRAAPWLEA